jgi:hypothetical protein
MRQDSYVYDCVLRIRFKGFDLYFVTLYAFYIVIGVYIQGGFGRKDADWYF